MKKLLVVATLVVLCVLVVLMVRDVKRGRLVVLGAGEVRVGGGWDIVGVGMCCGGGVSWGGEGM